MPSPPDTGPVRPQELEARRRRPEAATPADGPGAPRAEFDLGCQFFRNQDRSHRVRTTRFQRAAIRAGVVDPPRLPEAERAPSRFPHDDHWGRVVSLGLLANVVYQLLFIYGVDRTLAGNAGLVLATTPVWILVLASVSGSERHGLLVWGGVLATLGGMVLVVLGGDGGVGLGEGVLMGDLLLVLASITWAAYTVGTQDSHAGSTEPWP